MHEKRLFQIDYPEMDDDFGLEAAVRQHLGKRFSDLPPDLAEWVQARFHAVLSGVTWDQLEPCNRLNVAIRADELIKIEHVYRRRDEDKEAARRYTLAEAAKAISQSGEREKLILNKLCSAASRGDLAVYAAGEQARLPFGSEAHPEQLWGEAEAFWRDINIWLDEHEPRVGYRFLGPPRAEVKTTKKKKSGTPKLTDSQREEIIKRSAAGESQTDLGIAFGVSHQAISKLLAKWREDQSSKNRVYRLK
ncbi:hypothetical protein [Paraburkholderia caledonica]|uniref:Uncharacterized protein n=1 Tax=Paraburkholderia caledonica TaxID=134536 RepID=A0AB73I698_9BURK|nr:hypothetical protein [Paraburkholderia caledonica]